MMTGLHGIHVLLGMGCCRTSSSCPARPALGALLYPAEMSGLYWHFVDLVWIYLFPLLY